MKKEFSPLRTRLAGLSVVICFVASMAGAQTYTISDVSAPGGNPSFATGVNASGQVSGYTTTGAVAALAWRFTPNGGSLVLGNFGGSDSRALGINDAGTVTGYSTDPGGTAHGFVFNTGAGLVDIGGYGNGEGVFPQHINAAGQAAGFSPLAGNDRAFRFSPPGLTLDLGTIPGTTLPAAAAAYGMNDVGRVVGIASSPSGFNRAFRTDADGTGIADLGTLGGDESWAYAIDNAGDVVGTASSISTDSHAFLFTDGAGMIDLQTLGGYTSKAFALNNSGSVVGTAEVLSRDLHAFVWTAAGGMRDLNDIIPINSGWVLTEARAVNESGVIVGNGLLNGQPRAFLLKPDAAPDATPPVAITKTTNVTAVGNYTISQQVVFWDNVSLSAASIGLNAIRVTGPNGYSQLAIFESHAPLVDAMKISGSFYFPAPAAGWNGAANGSYSISIEPNTVRDVAGNFMPASVIGTFTVATELKPTLSVSEQGFPTMGVPHTFMIAALSSFPQAPTDTFTFTIDWNGDGSDMQTVSGGTGTTVEHTYNSTGSYTVRAAAVDLHGVTSDPSATRVFVGNPAFPQTWAAAPVLTGSHRLSVGLNAGGTIVNLGGQPVKGGKDIVQTLAPGAAAFVDGARLPTATIGLGAGVDALNRIIVYGGIEPNATVPNTNGYVYTAAGGGGAAIAAKHFAVHDFASAADNQHRLYSIGGAGAVGNPGDDSMGVERYDGGTNSWTTLAPLPLPRVSATAACDTHGHVIVIGGTDPATSAQTSTVFSYDIAANVWTQLGDAPGVANSGRIAATGADGLIYLIGGTNSASTYVFDTVAGSWYAGPNLGTARGAPAVALGNDGFIYVMGGDNVANGNNGLATTEKIDTGATSSPQILSTPGTSDMVGNPYGYQVIASGNPRPTFSLVAAPVGMTINSATGLIAWTPAPDQTGDNRVTVRASSAAGTGGQTFFINVVPIPTQTDFTPPTTPGAITLTFRTAASVSMTWPAATDNVGVTSYRIYGLFRGSRSAHIGLIASGITNRSYISQILATGYYVAAVDAAGNQSALSSITSSGTLTLPLIQHTNFAESATVIAGNSFLYTLSASATPTPTFTTFSGPAGMTFSRTSGPSALSDYGVVQWQPTIAQVGTYTFTVSATNPNTAGNSATFTVTVLPNGTDTVAPTPVAQMSASAISFDHCTLSWTAAGDNIGVTNYHIVATHFGLPGQSNHVVTLDLPGTNLTTPLAGLLPASGYTVTITPADAAGNTGSPTQMFFTTLITPVLNFRLSTGAVAGTLALDWSGSSAQWTYVVESSDTLAPQSWQPISIPLAATHFDITPTPGVPMQFYRIRATSVGP